jgi:membrane protease YdiL (CAAX protease family)
MREPSSKRTREALAPNLAEVLAVGLAGVLHVATELFVSPVAARIFNLVAVLAFVAYLVWRARSVPGTVRAWGMRRDNLFRALALQARWAIPAAVVIYVYGVLRGNTPLPITFWLTAALYPLWGVAQQFALQNLIGRNLTGWVSRPTLLALVSALLFSAAHFPDLPLMVLTLGAGFFFTLFFRREPNLWAVGILHGLLGGLAYYLVIGEDPAAALIGYFGLG